MRSVFFSFASNEKINNTDMDMITKIYTLNEKTANFSELC